MYSESCCYASNHSWFDPRRSSTFVNRTLNWDGSPVYADHGTKGEKLDISYGERSKLTTYLAFDTVTLNAHDKQPFVVKNQTISLVLAEEGAERKTRKNEALMGIGPSAASVAAGNVSTPFEQLCKHDRLQRPILGVTLVKFSLLSPESHSAGRLTLGSVDEESLLGKMTWITSTAETFWGASFIPGAIRFGNRDIWSPNDTTRRFSECAVNSKTGYHVRLWSLG